MSATNQTSSTSPPVSSQASLSPATASNQASSSASLTLGQAAAVISSGTTGTGNAASLVSGSNGQVIPNPTITYSQAGSSVSLAPGQATAAISSATTGTGNVTAPASGNNGQVSFNIGRSGLGLTLSPSLMHNNRRHTEVDYRCGICTGDILVKEKAAVRKASPLIFCLLNSIANVSRRSEKQRCYWHPSLAVLLGVLRLPKTDGDRLIYFRGEYSLPPA